jgi:hypothetical protein
LCDDYALNAHGHPLTYGSPRQHAHEHSHSSFLLFAFFLAIFGIVSLRLDPTASHDGGRRATVARRITQAAKPAIDLVKWAATWGDVIDSQSDCPVCLEPFSESRTVKMQPCRLHKVCKECATQWRAASRASGGGVATCPVCRGSEPNTGAVNHGNDAVTC